MSIVTLSTDFQTNDFIVGAMKGQLLSLNPELNIIDISHELNAQNYAHTAYVCKNALLYFPENSIHIVLVDLFKFPPTHLLISEYKKQYFITPDNGIITMILNNEIEQIAKVDLKKNMHSTTDITAQVAKIVNELSKGKYVRQIGKEITEIIELYPMLPAAGSDWIEGQIIFIDNNDNAIANITRKEFEEYGKGRKFTILFGRSERIVRIGQNYSSSSQGNIVAWFNSADHLEIGINTGKLASLFSLQDISLSQSKHNKMFETVRIIFEEEENKTENN